MDGFSILLKKILHKFRIQVWVKLENNNMYEHKVKWFKLDTILIHHVESVCFGRFIAGT